MPPGSHRMTSHPGKVGGTMMSRAKILHSLAAAALVTILLVASVPAEPGADSGTPSSATSTAAPKDSAVTGKGTRLFSQADVETLAGIVAGPGGATGEVLTGERLWDTNQSLHFGAGSAEVIPAECSDVIGWATLMAEGIPSAGTFSGTHAEPVFIALSADRDAALALALRSITKLPDCSPATMTLDDQSFTATYQRASAFTDADQSFAVIATIIMEGRRPAHFLRVAAKNGTLFVQATMSLTDPDNYRAEADRLTGYVNQVVHGEQQLLDGARPSPGRGPDPGPEQEPPSVTKSA